MQHVLVHIDLDSGLGPIGAWSYLDGRITHFYPESLDVGIPARARDYMAIRDEDTTVPEWFEHIALNAGGEDEFEAIEVNDGVSLPAIVAEFRRNWNTDRTH